MTARKTARLIAGGFVAALTVFETHYNRLSSHYSVDNDVARSFSLYSWARSLLSRRSVLPVVHADSVTLPVITPWNWNWDGRHDQSSSVDDASGSGDRPTRRTNCSRHLIFIRHGQYHDALNDSDCHLTTLGHEQLFLTGLRLKQLNFPYSIVHYSTMTRAVESTEEVLKHLTHVKAVPSDILREGAPYPLEPPLSYYRPSEKDFQLDGQRIESAFKTFVHRPEASQTCDSYEIFICHANVIRYIVCRALQIPPEAWIRFSLDHGSITWLVIRSDGRVTLRCIGDSGHMPPDKVTISNS